jgi:hypothetical protein
MATPGNTGQDRPSIRWGEIYLHQLIEAGSRTGPMHCFDDAPPTYHENEAQRTGRHIPVREAVEIHD